MAANRIHQLREPCIGKFADYICPELLHLELNNKQYVLHLIYQESLPTFIYAGKGIKKKALKKRSIQLYTADHPHLLNLVLFSS